MKQGIYGALLTAGLILALGIAGGSDAEILSTAFIDRGLVISAVMMFIGIFGLRLEDARERNNTRRKWHDTSDQGEDGSEGSEELKAG